MEREQIMESGPTLGNKNLTAYATELDNSSEDVYHLLSRKGVLL